MRPSRLVGSAVAVATVASIAVPVTQSPAIAADAPAPAASTQVMTPAQYQALRRQAVAQQRLIRKRKLAIRAQRLRVAIVRYALTKRNHVGQYVAGASSAFRFDCSGFTKHVYQRVAHIYLPHYSGSQLNLGRGMRVGKRSLLPGDLLAWGSNGSQHVSIYIGRGLMIGANNPSRDVVVESINNSYWAPRFAGARRVIVV